MDKRKHSRIVVQGMSIDVSDGMGCCSGEVRDISRLGMCLVDLAKRLGRDTAAYTVVASKEGQNFKFRVRQRWEKAGRLTKDMGVEINEVSEQWTEYVMSLESQQEEE